MSTYRQIPLTVNADTRRVVDALSLNPVSTRDAIGVSAGDVVVFCLSFIKADKTKYALGAGDQFDLYIDSDLVRELGTGALEAGASGIVSSLTVESFDTAPTSQSGSLVLINSAGDSETLAYTAWTLNTGVYTFTVDATLSYTYLAGDVVENVDPVMAQAGNSSVDIAGDWSEISRTDGKISIRVDCTSPTFFSKVSATSIRISGYIQVGRTPSGLSKSSSMLFDSIYLSSSLQRSGFPALPSSGDFYTKTEADALFAPAAGSADIVTTGTVTTGIWSAGSTVSPIITVAAGAPSITPSKPGDIYINSTSTSDIYIAFNSTSSADWVKVS